MHFVKRSEPFSIQRSRRQTLYYAYRLKLDIIARCVLKHILDNMNRVASASVRLDRWDNGCC